MVGSTKGGLILIVTNGTTWLLMETTSAMGCTKKVAGLVVSMASIVTMFAEAARSFWEAGCCI